MAAGAYTVSCIYNCGQRLSPDASICPKCGKAQAVSQHVYGCHTCGTPLSRSEYRYFVSHGLVFSEVHRACPTCGDPQPLWTPFDTFLQTVKLVFSVVVVVLAIVVGVVLIRNIQAYRYEFGPLDWSQLDAEYEDYYYDGYDLERYRSHRHHGCSTRR